MKVLSLFDGIACGRAALNIAGIGVEKYIAYEIEPTAIKIAKHNWPTIEHHGDVTKADFRQFHDIDLLIGGSPCQYWSIAKAGHGREIDINGQGWKLFHRFVDAWVQSGAKYFLYENNHSIDQSIKDKISEVLGVQPLEINSALVSAQNRRRCYWTNIPNASIPADKGILLKDIIEDGVVDRDKSLCITRRYSECVGSQDYLARRYFGKSCGQIVFSQDPTMLKNIFKSVKGRKFTADDIKDCQCKLRPLTPEECEKLQTLPVGYTDSCGLKRNQRIAAIGNGWTVDVIAHLMAGLK